LERYVMRGGRGGDLSDWIGGESPRALVDELERHTRALLRDVVCGYLDPDLKSLADDLLLEASKPPPPPEPALPPEPAPPPALPPEPEEIEARDLREKDLEPKRFEREPQPEGVTPSADWDEFSAPV
jgi:hypothetical protein